VGVYDIVCTFAMCALQNARKRAKTSKAGGHQARCISITSRIRQRAPARIGGADSMAWRQHYIFVTAAAPPYEMAAYGAASQAATRLRACAYHVLAHMYL